MSIKSELYKLLESNEGNSISCARLTTFTCSIIGIILCVLHFFGVGTNADVAYTMLGIGIGAGTLKSIIPQHQGENTVVITDSNVEINEENS